MGSAEGYGKKPEGTLFFSLSLSPLSSFRPARGFVVVRRPTPKPRPLSEDPSLPPSFFCHIMRHGRGETSVPFREEPRPSGRGGSHGRRLDWEKKRKKIRKVDVLGRRK